MNTLRIATRASDVGLRRGAAVKALLEQIGVESVLVPLKTTGDKATDKPLESIGVRGLFTKEIESALVRKKADIAVHALDVLPTDDEDSLVIAALLRRYDPRDAFVVSKEAQGGTFAELPAGSRLATSSLRVRALVRALRGDIDFAELRGDVSDRLKKIDEGRVHAGIIPANAMHSIGAEQHITELMELPGWLPAPGQGVLAIQSRADNPAIRELVARLDDPATAQMARAEVAFSNALEGGGQVPVGAVVVDGVLHGMIASVDGEKLVRGSLELDSRDPSLTGVRLANQLRGAGASDILDGLRRAQRIPPAQPD